MLMHAPKQGTIWTGHHPVNHLSTDMKAEPIVARTCEKYINKKINTSRQRTSRMGFTLTDIFLQQHSGENTCGLSGYT